jgi:glutaredoxin-like protein NrdH
MPKTVTLYTNTDCTDCIQAEKWLQNKGVEYREINLDDHPERLDDLKQIGVQPTLPVIVIVDDTTNKKETIIGWEQGRLVQALGSIASKEIGA